ncbi:MAG: sodium:proton antiporter [Prevotella sp.]|nr:sodium:proton antiporter [Prevotella sp.]
MLALIPFIVLIALLVCCISVFGNATLDGASQVSLIIATGICVLIGWLTKRLNWPDLDKEITRKVASCTPSIIILLLIGAISGTWMVSGIVPTMIYYGLQILSPQWFLVTTCIICAMVSLMIGSSWTTIATVGLALLGIGKAMGFADGWTAGAIICGAYFGDKLSPLSDTTVLASSVSGTPLFTHIRYMMKTTIPTFIVTLLIFLCAGLMMRITGEGDVKMFMEGLSHTFVISPWLLLVPVGMGLMIAYRWPSLVVLFLATLAAALMALLVQPDRLREIASVSGYQGSLVLYEGAIRAIYDNTHISTGVEALDKLVSTRGMAGMMPTIWLIISAQVFAGALTATGQLQDIMNYFRRLVKGTTSLVASTVGSAIFLNITSADQFLSIILTSSMFKDMYAKMGYESRLLSRSCEDGGTVTSVLVPWNTCGLTQSTVLGVATLTYLPYCFFNLLSPIVSIAVAALGWKIKRQSHPID